MYLIIVNLHLGQDVANNIKRAIDNCPYGGQNLSPIASCSYGSLIYINPSCHGKSTREWKKEIGFFEGQKTFHI